MKIGNQIYLKGVLVMHDLERWENILKKDKKNLKRFDLFGTPATILWNENEDEIYIICLNRFINQAPEITSKYDYFGFDLKRWLWSAYTPHGAADRIKEEIQKVFGQRKKEKPDYFPRFRDDILKYQTPEYFIVTKLFDSMALVWYFPKKNQIRIMAPQRFTKGIGSKSYETHYYEIQNGKTIVNITPAGAKQQTVELIQNFHETIKGKICS
jgi:hypothetical protein